EGLVVVAIDYRLSGPGRRSWLGNLDDVRAALRWVQAHAGEYGIDPDRVALLGASAGAHLALLSTSGAQGEAPPDATRGDETRKRSSTDPRVRAVIDFYGPTDLKALFRARRPAGESISQLLGGSPGQIPERYEAASP